MRRLNSKISSFSLAEMLVVLVLSGIIIGVIYVAYYNVSTYQLSITRRYGALQDAGQLFFLMQRDVERSGQIVASAAGLYCTALGAESVSAGIVYVFSPDFCVRRQAERIDTFRCKLSQPEFRWKGDAVSASDSSVYVDEIQVEADFQRPVKIHIFKAYDAASMIEMTSNDTLP